MLIYSSYEQTVEILKVLKELSAALISTCDGNTSLCNHPIRTNLSTFRDANLQILTRILDTNYRARFDTTKYNADLYMISTTARSDFEVLHTIILRTSSPSYSPTSSKLRDLGRRLDLHAKDLNRISDQIAGNEDWSNLTPFNIPSTPSRRPRSDKKVAFTPSPGGSSRNSASFQPTVEEVIDDGEDAVSPKINTYHISPTELERRLSNSSSLDRGPSPIRFVLRSPTDPEELQNHVRTLNLKDIEAPIAPKPEPLDDITDLSARPSRDDVLDAKKQSIQKEIDRLSDEIRSLSSKSGSLPSPGFGLSEPFQFNRQKASSPSSGMRQKTSWESNSSDSNYYSAQTSRYSLDDSLNIPERRPRASTTGSAESGARPSLGSHALSDETVKRYSPRYSPYNPNKDYSPRRYGESPNRISSTGRPSSNSRPPSSRYSGLPTVLEKGSRRDGSERGRKRSSWAPNGNDFDLFESSTLSSTPLFKATSPSPARSHKSDNNLGNITLDLAVRVADLCAGVKKRVRVECLREDDMSGQLRPFTDVFDVEVLPGLKFGKTITLPGCGDYVPHLRSHGDIIFTLTQKSDDKYSLEGSKVMFPMEITLLESVIGWQKLVSTAWGTELELSEDKCTPHGSEFVIENYGLPQWMGKGEKPGPRDQMIIKITVIWPTTELDSTKKAYLKRALEGGERLSRRK